MFSFEIGANVYDRARKQNGTIVNRRYEEQVDIVFSIYYVCYSTLDKVEYEWTSANWLTLGEKVVD